MALDPGGAAAEFAYCALVAGEQVLSLVGEFGRGPREFEVFRLCHDDGPAGGVERDSVDVPEVRAVGGEPGLGSK